MTEISQLLGSTIRVSDAQNQDWQRRLKWHISLAVPSYQKSVKKAQLYASKLQLDPLVVETTALYLAKLHRASISLRGKLPGVFALAVRFHRPSMPLKDVALVCGVHPVRLAVDMHKVADVLGIEAVKNYDIRPRLLRAVEGLDLGRAFYVESLGLYERYRREYPNGSKDASVFGAILYEVCRSSGNWISQRRIAAVMGVSEYTLRETVASVRAKVGS